jgi:superfamily I DNA/RNA helicase
MLQFATKFPQLEIIVLENNYRSIQNILDLCTALINNNEERLSKRINSLEKKLISSNPELSNLNFIPTLVVLNTLEEEKAYLLSEVKKYIES